MKSIHTVVASNGNFLHISSVAKAKDKLLREKTCWWPECIIRPKQNRRKYIYVIFLQNNKQLLKHSKLNVLIPLSLKTVLSKKQPIDIHSILWVHISETDNILFNMLPFLKSGNCLGFNIHHQLVCVRISALLSWKSVIML